MERRLKDRRQGAECVRQLKSAGMSVGPDSADGSTMGPATLLPV